MGTYSKTSRIHRAITHTHTHIFMHTMLFFIYIVITDGRRLLMVLPIWIPTFFQDRRTFKSNIKCVYDSSSREKGLSPCALDRTRYLLAVALLYLFIFYFIFQFFFILFSLDIFLDTTPTTSTSIYICWTTVSHL